MLHHQRRISLQHKLKYAPILLASAIIITVVSLIPINCEIYRTYQVLDASESRSSNSSSNIPNVKQRDGVQQQQDEASDTKIRIDRAGRSIEFHSPIKRILDLLSHHHTPSPVIVVSPSNNSPVDDQLTANNERQQPPIVAGTSATASSDHQQQWTLVSGNPQALNDGGGSASMLVAQPQQLMQTSMPYEQYFLAPNNMMMGNQQQPQPQFAMMPTFNQPAQVMSYGDPRQQQPQIAYLPANTNPEQFIQQSNNMGESVQPIFLSSYVPEVQRFLSQQQPQQQQTQPQQQQQQQQQQSINMGQPNSIQQVQQQAAVRQSTRLEQPEAENENHSDDEPPEPARSNGAEPDSGGGDSSEAGDDPSSGSSGSSSYEDKYDSDKDGPQTESSRNHAKTDATGDAMMTKSSFVNVGLNDDCMQCICRASSGCDQHLGCITRGSEEKYCGPFQLTEEYWNSAGSPDDSPNSFSSFEDCANDVDCAVTTVTNYMKKHHKDCDGDYNITCIDYARLHRLKPDECGNTVRLVNEFDAYWARFRNCAEGYDRSRSGDNEDI